MKLLDDDGGLVAAALPAFVDEGQEQISSFEQLLLRKKRFPGVQWLRCNCGEHPIQAPPSNRVVPRGPAFSSLPACHSGPDFAPVRSLAPCSLPSVLRCPAVRSGRSRRARNATTTST